MVRRQEATPHRNLGAALGLSEVDQVRSGANEDALVYRITQSQRVQAARLISLRDLSPEAMRFVEFVEQCEAQEARTGRPCMVRASY